MRKLLDASQRECAVIPARAACLALLITSLACVEREPDRANAPDEDLAPAAADDESEPALDARVPPPSAMDAALWRPNLDASSAIEGPQREAGPAEPDAHAAGDSDALDARSRDDAGPQTCGDCCPDGFPRGRPAHEPRRVAALAPSPEGVTVCPGGEVFVALDGSGEIWHVPLSGAPERWAQLGDRRPAGVTCDARGRLFVAVFASRSGDAIPIEVLMVAARDAVPLAMPQPSNDDPLQGLNGIVAVPGQGVYASDTVAGKLVQVRERADGAFETRVVARDVSLANGLAYGPGARKLYAAASGALRVLAFAIDADGALDAPAEVPLAAFVLFIDGVAVDERGEVYVADYLGGAVVRASDGDQIAQLPTPASLAFRGGTLLITEYNVLDAETEGGLHALELGVCGATP